MKQARRGSLPGIGEGNGPEQLSEQDPKFVTALARGLQILAAFEGAMELGNQELGQRTGMAPATVTRLTHTLMALGYLRRSPGSKKFIASVGALGPSISIRKHLATQSVTRPQMERLARETESTVILGVRDQLSILFLDVIRPVNASLTVNTDTGSTVPLGTTSAGLAYLVAAPLKEQTGLLEELRAQHSEEEWIAMRQEIQRANESYRRNGFVVRIRSQSREVNSVSVPVQLGTPPVQYVLTCAGPTRTFTQRKLTQQLGPALLEMVRRVHKAG